MSDGRLSLDTNGHPVDPFIATPTTTNIRTQLQTLLDEKEKQLQLASALGQRILDQNVELEARVNALEEYDRVATSGNRTPDPEGDPEMRRKLQELAEVLQTWETENEQIWSGFGQKLTNGPPSARPPQTPLTPSASPTKSQHRGLPPEPEPDPDYPTVASGPSAAQSSRRAKNAAHRENDVKFAYDIGTSLLTEVRRLQSLLSERDKTIQEMGAERDDLEKENDSLRSSLRQQEASADKFKEENWNLEVQIQEARTQQAEAQQAAGRAELEVKRMTKQLAQSRETAETQKSEAERVGLSLQEMKVKHETDVAQMRKQAAQHNREKGDLQATIDSLKTEITKRDRTIQRRFGSPQTNTEQREVATPSNQYHDEDMFAGASTRKKLGPDSAYLTPGGVYDPYRSEIDSSPDLSPSRPGIILAPNHPSNELETLRQALGHAHRKISKLERSQRRQKDAYEKKLGDAGLSTSIPGAWEDEEEDEEDETPDKPLRPARAIHGRGNGRPLGGRGFKKLTLAQRLGIAAIQKHAGDDDDDDDYDDGTPENSHLLDEEVEGEGDEQEEEPSPFHVPSRPTSVDGMDPAFANVLRNMDWSPHGPSPLARREQASPSVNRMAVMPRKTRAGAGFKAEKRPDSIVGPPTSLGSQLSDMGDQSTDGTLRHSVRSILGDLGEEDVTPAVLTPRREYAEMNTQTDPEVLPPPPEPAVLPPVVVPTPKPETAECSIQTDAPPMVIYAEQSIGTDPLPTPPTTPKEVPALVAHLREYAEMDVQTDEMVAVEIQTNPVTPVRDVEIRSLVIEREEVESPGLSPVPFPIRTTVEGAAYIGTDEAGSPLRPRTPRVTSNASVLTARPVGMIFEESEDGHPETDTDAEFMDARESILPTSPTPGESVTSFRTATGGEVASESEQSDAESVMTSHMAVRERYASLSTHGRKYSQSRRTSGQVPPPPPPPPPKPEVKEASIQTDEWKPPTPPDIVIPIPPSPAKSFHRVGNPAAAAPPFQFVSSPPRNPDTSFTSAGTATPTQDRPGQETPVRDSSATFGTLLGKPASLSHDRRTSIESRVSENDGMSRSQTLPLPPPVDKTRPPVMMMPPPPPMPPPAIIPTKKIVGPPPRPTSPPPPELIQRATTPTFGLRSTTPTLNVPTIGRGYARQHGSGLPQGLRQASTTSFRSAPHQPNGVRSPVAGVFDPHSIGRRDHSTTSLLSGGSSVMPSRRPSVSSSQSGHMGQPRTPGRPSMSANGGPTTTANGMTEDDVDVDVIHAITQTMIGEFLYKYTRRVVGKGHGEKRHKRFFWIHPYTKTLYWSSADPGSAAATESSAKSAYIDSVKAILDPNPLPPGVYQYSIVVSTPQRDMKFTAPTKERHDIWYSALKYLLDRPTTIPVNEGEDHLRPAVPRQPTLSNEDSGNFMTSPRRARSVHSTQSYSITPRAMRSQTQLSSQSSAGKRPGTPAAEYLRWAEEVQKSPTRSVRSYRQGNSYRTDDEDYEHVEGPDDEPFELHDEGYEAMENVRACCEGEHDLGTLSRRPGQPPHHHHHHHRRGSSVSRPLTPAERPTSPSGWSLRSRAGSTRSEGGSRLSQWAGEAKRSIRFTNRGKSPAPRPSINVPRTNN